MEITMRVKVNCCRSCQKKAKTILEQADGVQAICMDIGEGLLTVVTGDVEPFLLIEMVEKEVRKRVELRSFQRYPARGGLVDRGGGNDGHHEAIKEANLRRARDRKKAACCGVDKERAGHADSVPAGPHWPGRGRCHPVAGPCQHQGDPGWLPFWNQHGPLPPPECFAPPWFPPPCHWFCPMPPPPMQPPLPRCHHHEAHRPKNRPKQ
ncbi:hypothetical protein NL676_005791 [Syzygium grande]|nr:hypothetical protein NL676_005791 [Syzygium grande]